MMKPMSASVPLRRIMGAASCVLNDRQEVHVRVVKPGNLGTVGRAPDALGVLHKKAVALKQHALGGEAVDDLVDIVDLEGQNGVCRGRDRRYARNAHARILALEDRRVAVVGDEFEAE